MEVPCETHLLIIEEENERLRETLAIGANQNADLNQHVAELEAECNSLAHQLNQCNERGGRILAENEALRKQVTGMQFSQVNLREKIEALKANILSARKYVSSGQQAADAERYRIMVEDALSLGYVEWDFTSCKTMDEVDKYVDESGG